MPDVVSLVALSLTCLSGCVKGLIVLSKAKHYNRDMTDVRLQTELILHSLTTWAQEAGLTQDPPTLLISANNAALVPDILGQLMTLLSNIHDMRQRYGIYLQPTDEDVESVDDDESILMNDASQRRRWTGKVDIKAIFLKRKEPWKRLTWVIMDDKKFDRMLEKAKGYVSELSKFLEQARQDRMEAHLEFCVRTAILHANGDRELGIIGKEFQKVESKAAISAAAKLKQTRLRLGISESPPEQSTVLTKSISTVSFGSNCCQTVYDGWSDPSKSMKLSMRLLTLGRAARAERLRTLAQYNGSMVLLEWKYVTVMNDPAIIRRVNQVAAFLQDVGAAVHSLQCRGYVEDHIAKRYGYIFDIPQHFHDFRLPSARSLSMDNIMRRAPPVPELHSLRQLLDQHTSPSLNNRLTLAVTFLETLLNLHTSGWLHKELRSDNIILIKKDDSDPSTTSVNDLSGYSVYVAGYVYSRIDSPGEMTEPLNSDLEADLYRHPSSLYGVRQPFRKSLDIFSVGCTLLEIGLWMGLRQILTKYSISATTSQAKPSGKLPPIYERSFSDPTLAHSSAALGQKTPSQSAREPDANVKRPLDLMELKHELLLSQMDEHQSDHSRSDTRRSPSTAASEKPIMASLEAAMGRRYTAIVEEFLAAADTVKELGADEHDFALDLEMKARDSMRAIANAM